MFNYLKYIFFVLILQGPHSFAALNTNKILNLTQAQAGVIFLQTTDGSSSGVIFNYTPRYLLNSDLSAGLNLGIQSAKYRQDQTLTALEYLAVGDYRLNEVWQASLLIGAQSWLNNGSGTYFASGAQLTYQLSAPVFGSNLSIWGRYLNVAYTPVVQTISTGIEIQF